MGMVQTERTVGELSRRTERCIRRPPAGLHAVPLAPQLAPRAAAAPWQPAAPPAGAAYAAWPPFQLTAHQGALLATTVTVRTRLP